MKEIGIYVHIPFCVKKCIYCDFTSYANKIKLSQKYVEVLKKEISFQKEQLKGEEIKVTLSGGSNGTASSLTDEDFIGKDEGPGSRTGIQAFLDNADANIMAVPGIVQTPPA